MKCERLAPKSSDSFAPRCSFYFKPLTSNLKLPALPAGPRMLVLPRKDMKKGLKGSDYSI